MSMLVADLVKQLKEKQITQKQVDVFSENKNSNSERAVKQKLQLIQRVRERVLEKRKTKVLDYEEQEVITEIIWQILEEEAEINYSQLNLSSLEKEEIVDSLVLAILGLGIIEPLLADSEITEIMINGCERIFYEKNGKIHRALNKRGGPLRFNSEEEIMHLIEKIVSPINRKVDESNPIVDARLPDGSRVNVVIPPVSLDGPTVTIRKFSANPFTMEDMIKLGTITPEVADLLDNMVKAKFNLVISGGTGTGKTSFLNTLSMSIPATERVVTIEDAAELQLNHVENIVRLETRPPNIEGKGAISMRDLVRTSLRMRPDRIIVGEVRGGEALDMLQAMNTGHEGSLTTAHANSAEDILSRLETMVLMAGLELPSSAIKSQIASAIDCIIHLDRLRDGSRKVVQLSQIVGFENDKIKLEDIYRWQPSSCREEGEQIYELRWTGAKILRSDKFLRAGIKINPKFLL